MEFELHDDVLKIEKNLTDLDRLVLDFLSVLDEYKVKYVIISGYVAIFFGRTRTTEDIDLFIEKIDSGKIAKLYDRFIEKGYWFLNTADKKETSEMLNDMLAIRIARKDEVVPNFEVKFPKKDIDFRSFKERIKVIIRNKTLYMSPIEIQIPFKIWLGSEKDIEDAIHLYSLFNEKLNKKSMNRIGSAMGVEEKMIKYGIK